MNAERIEIRPCTKLEEFDRCVELQRLVWGFADVELVPKDVIAVTVMSGGQVFGAYDGRVMVGFLLGFPAYRDGRAYIHSHMLAVLESYRDQGVGRRLKLRQREDALARGLDVVEWTFDPLELKNAYFNLERLGAIVRRYLPNKYGRTTSPLHAGLPTDRLVAEWWLRAPRVEAAVARRPVTHAADCRRLTIRADIAELKRKDQAAAERVQSEARAQFEKLFAQGLVVTGFVLDKQGGTYLLEPYKVPQ